MKTINLWVIIIFLLSGRSSHSMNFNNHEYPTMLKSLSGYCQDNSKGALARIGYLSAIGALEGLGFGGVCLNIDLNTEEGAQLAKKIVTTTTLVGAVAGVVTGCYNEYKFFKYYHVMQLFCTACLNDDNKTLKKLINEHGLPDFALHNDQQTALHYATYFNALRCVKELVHIKELVNQANSAGDTPLSLAMQQRHNAAQMARIENQPQICSILLQNGARLDMKNNRGYAPIHYAIHNGKIGSIVSMILYSHFNPLQKGIESIIESKVRVYAAKKVLRAKLLPEEIVYRIISYLPDDVGGLNDLSYVVPHASLEQLIPCCDYDWFQQYYKRLGSTQQTLFLNKFVPACANYRIDMMKKLLSDEYTSKLVTMMHTRLFLNTLDTNYNLIQLMQSTIKLDFFKLGVDKYPSLRSYLKPGAQLNHSNHSNVRSSQ